MGGQNLWRKITCVLQLRLFAGHFCKGEIRRRRKVDYLLAMLCIGASQRVIMAMGARKGQLKITAFFEVDT